MWVNRVVAGSCRSLADFRNAPKADAKSGHWHLTRWANSGLMHCSKPSFDHLVARTSAVAGPSRPIALAVLRLMTSSYLVGACTGMPFRRPRDMTFLGDGNKVSKVPELHLPYPIDMDITVII